MLSAALILPQSILLGMTFPLMSGGILRRWPNTPGRSLAMLYFTNSIGGAIGVLVSGFYLINAFGLPGTIMTAGLINILLALVVWLLTHDQPVASPIAAAASGEPQADRWMRWMLAVAAVTGAASFVYEIAWIRMLSLVLGSSTHAFELMLSAFILGLALGGLWIKRRIETLVDPMRTLGYIQVVMGLLALATLPLYNMSFDIMFNALSSAVPDRGRVSRFQLDQPFHLPADHAAGDVLRRHDAAADHVRAVEARPRREVDRRGVQRQHRRRDRRSAARGERADAAGRHQRPARHRRGARSRVWASCLLKNAHGGPSLPVRSDRRHRDAAACVHPRFRSAGHAADSRRASIAATRRCGRRA